MKKDLELIISPDDIFDKEVLYKEAAVNLKLAREEIKAVVPVRRSIDARSREPVYKVFVNVYINESPREIRPFKNYKPVQGNKKVIVVGSGPAGLFASLKLIELGIKPVILERGKDVQSRRRDLRAIQQHHKVNPDSNYCFGEGGAGTYSDGKLYTRATKRGDVSGMLNVLVMHGAAEDILIDSHPHIGSNKLPGVVKSIRETIISNGGEIHFKSKLTDILIKDGQVTGVVINDENELSADALILAAGHSARDIYHLLHRKNLLLEAKPFAMGVRIEHPQSLINEVQYHTKHKHKNLPAAPYSLSCQVEDKGIYSFCMCPGGIIVPAATSPGEIVVNGMSLSRRDSPFANSGFVVTVDENDWKNIDAEEPFKGLELQHKLEAKCFELAGGTQSAPAQRVTDFLKRKFSDSLPPTSYIPGLTSSDLHNELPDFITRYLMEALYIFNKKMRGYITDEAILVAAESRTSSPVRIPRDRATFMHSGARGLFPAGEGAGYAGGIVSAALDGENCAEAAALYINSHP
jgi:uncharacterized FAD-dependent dehydrogenase